ncbi:MAG TPA: energy transducer TonB [Cyclobacteriaceae bacterium]|nr:energy transducer TonB [Cyclobacteriaceae bacterium]
MKTEITRPTWEDVVFESRNKAYGAYLIRKSYDNNVSKASVVSICIAAIIFAALQVASLMHVEIKIVTPTIPGLHPGDLPIIKLDVSKTKTELRRDPPANKDLIMRVVSHEVADTPPVKPTEIVQTASQTGSTTGVGTAGTETGIVAEIPVAVAPPKVFDHPEVMPAYEGGVRAMIMFISRNIHYPSVSRAMGQEGTVYVRFVINDLGQVVDVEVIKGVSTVLDKEAMRVVSLMTKWKPGSQNNIPVNVRMVIPIKFKLEIE